MSAHPESGPAYTTGAGPARADAHVDHASGYCWIVFAGTMLMLVGVLNVIYGIAAIDDSTFFVNDAKYVISDLNTWGWVVLVTGALQLLSGFGIWVATRSRRGPGSRSPRNCIGVLLMLLVYPLLSISLFAVDVLIVYGLLVHGGHRAQA